MGTDVPFSRGPYGLFLQYCKTWGSVMSWCNSNMYSIQKHSEKTAEEAFQQESLDTLT